MSNWAFKPGDLVTSVNGIALNDPANTMRLYQTMRSASEAVFDLQRDDQPLTVSVSLGDEAAGTMSRAPVPSRISTEEYS